MSSAESRRMRPGLSTVKTFLELLSKPSAALPPLQAVVETMVEIAKYAEVCQQVFQIVYHSNILVVGCERQSGQIRPARSRGREPRQNPYRMLERRAFI